MTQKSHSRERDVENYFVTKLKQKDFECIKFIPDGRIGMPDRLVLLPGGRVLWVELKTEGGKLSVIQGYRHKELELIGHVVKVVWTKEQADELVEWIEEYSAEQKLIP